MKALLSEIATTITKKRYGNLHKGVYLPGKPIQLVASDSKLLIEREELDNIFENKSKLKRQRGKEASSFARASVISSKGINAKKDLQLWAPLSYVQISMFQTDEKTMGLERNG
ncbi:hypothetical protein AYI68_g310 [Smittium mucronatum]|uniref:Uncharacterized protein n=1 Tax=Smittium mucronatum TaxID=133383 RepID=A0A1R0H8I8_9FUNG|nr:hypothetical protein AYI68_g310 [Smittium mucronatum]